MYMYELILFTFDVPSYYLFFFIEFLSFIEKSPDAI